MLCQPDIYYKKREVIRLYFPLFFALIQQSWQLCFLFSQNHFFCSYTLLTNVFSMIYFDNKTILISKLFTNKTN